MRDKQKREKYKLKKRKEFKAVILNKSMVNNALTRDDLLELLATSFNKFLFDNFQSTEQINVATTGTGLVTPNLMDFTISTGILANSTAKAYYSMNWFNPVYSKLYIRAYMNSMNDVKAFFGFKESTEDIDWNDSVQIKESSAGFMIENGKLYAYTSRLTNTGPPAVYSQQKTEIMGIDLTKDFIFKIENEKFSTFPLPQIIPYFDIFRIITPDRIWTIRATNGTFPPEDKVHYIYFSIKNTTGTEKFIKVKSITYGEEYAD